MSNDKHVTYEDAGVDTAEGARAVDAIKAAVKVKGLPISTKIFEPAVQATEADEAAIAELLAE